MHAHLGTRVAGSPIAGRGLFATESAAAGQVVATDVGDVTTEAFNHSCDPTLVWLDDGTLVALRDLDAGVELTVDYATSTSDPAYVLFCHCETYRCRQVVEGTDWRIPQLQRRYAGHWTSAVQGLIDATPATGYGV